jgi:glycosyltransferase involved in cell wall biosynthesis
MASKVLFVSRWDPSDVASWSGTPFYMLKALRDVADVEVLKLHHPQVVRFAGAGATALLRQKVAVDRSRPVLRAYADQIHQAADRSGSGVVFAPSNIPITAVDRSLKCAYWTDAVFTQIAGLYPQRFPYARSSIDAALRQERQALVRANAAAYSSQWAIDGARELVREATPLLLEFGPNLPDAAVDRVRSARDRRTPRGPVRLLWIGVQWERKGGAAAVLATERLVDDGIDAELHVVGAEPPATSPVVRYHGTLSKTVPDQLAELESLLTTADVFLLPSRADCTPVVVSEAAAVGLPVVATDVGGLGEMVERHRIGVAVSETYDEAAALASAVRRVLEERGTYTEACAAAAAGALNYRVSFERLLRQIG